MLKTFTASVVSRYGEMKPLHSLPVCRWRVSETSIPAARAIGA
jgi:hypothetical protein